jgi:hypothetical protein
MVSDSDASETVQEAAVRLYRSEIPSRAIVRQTGLSLWAVYQALDAAGVPRRGRPAALLKGPQIRTQRAHDAKAKAIRSRVRSLTYVQRAARDRELADAYADPSLSVEEIASSWKVGRETIRRAARRFNVPVRRRPEVTLSEVAQNANTSVAATVANVEADAANARMAALGNSGASMPTPNMEPALRHPAPSKAGAASVRRYRVALLVEQVLEASTVEDALRQARGYAGVKDVLAIRQSTPIRY